MMFMMVVQSTLGNSIFEGLIKYFELSIGSKFEIASEFRYLHLQFLKSFCPFLSTIMNSREFDVDEFE